VLKWLCAGVVEAVLSVFTFLLLTGRYINAGPVLLRISDSHGLHAGDLVVVAAWVVATAALLLLVNSSRTLSSR
jgi:hypothetical protein